MKQGDRFRPSNSDEGLGFEEAWCYGCERDRGYREDSARPDLGCPTLAGAYAESESPAWVYDEHGKPKCLEFVPEGEDLPPEVHPDQGTLL